MYITATVPGKVELDGRFPGFTAVHRRGQTYVASHDLGTFGTLENANRIRGLSKTLRDYLSKAARNPLPLGSE